MSTYSSSLRIELPGDGTQAGTWGDTTNSNLAYILDTSVAGYQTVSVVAASQALTFTNGPTSTAASNQAVYAMLRFTTTTGATFAVYAPPASKAYIVWNNSGQSMTIYNSSVIGNTTAAGTGITVANGDKVFVWSDATNFYEIKSGNVTGVVPVLNGGTGVTTSTGTGSTVLSASPTFTGTPLAPTAAFGTDTTQIATTAFVRDIIPTGVITMWYGSIASIPSGWNLCDGTNSTPDLRDRFIVGAGTTYAVDATGGSANAILVSHTHTTTSSSTFTGTALGTHTHTITDPGHTHTPGSVSDNNINAGSSNGGSVQSPAAIPPAFTGISIVGISAGTPAGTVDTTVTNSTEGVSGTGANLPPYYALAYIMKA
jgi:hypothetical protein